MSENAGKSQRKSASFIRSETLPFHFYAVLILRNFALNRLQRILIAKNSAYAKYTEFLCFKVLVFGDLTVRRGNVVQNTRCCGSGAILCRTAVTIISARSTTTAIIAVVAAVSVSVIAAATVITLYVALAALRADHNVTGKVFALAPRLRTLNLLHGGVDDAALIRIHRLQGSIATGLHGAGSHLSAEIFKRFLAFFAVIAHVQRNAVIRLVHMVCNERRKILEGI